MAATQTEPITLFTVNTAPERAKLLVGRFINEVREKYNIVHIGNTVTMDGLAETLKKEKPQVVFCASMWTPEQQAEIQQIARDTLPGVKTAAIPPGLQVKEGPDAVVKFLVENAERLELPARGTPYVAVQ